MHGGKFLQKFNVKWEHGPGRINVGDPVCRMLHHGQVSDGFQLSTLHRHVLFATTRRAVRAQGDTTASCSERVAAAEEVVETRGRVASGLCQYPVQVSPGVSERVAAGLQGTLGIGAVDDFLSAVRVAYAEDPSWRWPIPRYHHEQFMCRCSSSMSRCT